MDSGPSLSSTPRKSIGKPMLRLSIPTPNAQFTPTRNKREASSSALNVTNKSTIADGQISNIVDNCSHDATNATNKNNQSEVQKLIRSERLAQPNKCRSDASTSDASPSASGFESSSTQSQQELHAEDANDDNDDSNACMPSYKTFEHDIRRRIDEMNAANRFDMRLKGIIMISCCCFFALLCFNQSISQSG